MKQSGGFTLIELLIVVAIIGILAAIAIPNFLEAQMRAKVAKVQSEYRNIKTALYTYAVDHNEWPPDEDEDLCDDDFSTFWSLRELSTPIPYMTHVPYQDPFSEKFITDDCGIPQSPHYQYYNLMYDETDGSRWGGAVRYLWPNPPDGQVAFIDWYIINLGPWQDWPFIGTNWAPGITYDASNGTVSSGVLWVSEVGIFGE